MSEGKVIAVMQPYLLPYIGYFQLAHLVDHFVFLDDVNYIKKGWINRNNILGHNESIRFTVPLTKASQNKKINETFTAIDDVWCSKFFNSIKQNYQRAPNYKKVLELLEDLFISSDKNGLISELAIKSVSKVFDYLNVPFSYSRSSELPLTQLKGQDRIITICKHYNATQYVNPVNGQSLYNIQDFRDEGIGLQFLEMDNLRYNQRLGQKFEPFLSVIDILMFLTKTEVKNQLTKFKLI